MKADLFPALPATLAVLLSLPVSAQTTPPAPPPPAAAVPGTAGPPPKPPLADVAFLAGSWTDATADHYSEEVWTTPAGDSMEGMWRYVVDGKVRRYALVCIRDEEGGTVLRVRHFDGELAPREERALTLKLVETGDRHVRFEGPASGAAGPVTLVYKRDGDTLTGSLTKNGTSEEFRFRLKRWGGSPASDRYRRRGWTGSPPR